MDDGSLYQALVQYFVTLENRRWQHFAVLLVVDGLMLNAWNGLRTSRQLGAQLLLIFLCLTSLLVFAAVLRLMSRIRARVNMLVIQINLLSPCRLFEEGSPNRVHWNGVTLWLYAASIFLAVPWFVALWALSSAISIGAIVGFVAFLICGIRWRLPDYTGFAFYDPDGRRCHASSDKESDEGRQ